MKIRSFKTRGAQCKVNTYVEFPTALAEAPNPYYNSNYLPFENRMKLCQQQLCKTLFAAQMRPQGAQ